MGTTTRTLLTFEQFENLPDEPGKDELLDGELLHLPPAKLPHYKTSRQLSKLLETIVEAAHTRGEALDLGEVHHECGYQLTPQTWLQPDVSIAHASQGEGDYFQGAPAIAIEVVSPSNTPAKLEKKAKLYLENGAREVWHFYPKQRRIVVITPDGRTTLEAGDVLTTPLLPGFSLAVADILG